MRVWFILLVLLCARPLAAQTPAFHTLEVSYVALQAFDAGFTYTATKTGLVDEVNPLAKLALSHPGGWTLLKSGITLGTLFTARTLWRQDHKRAAWAVLIGATASMVAVTVNNRQQWCRVTRCS